MTTIQPMSWSHITLGREDNLCTNSQDSSLNARTSADDTWLTIQ